ARGLDGFETTPTKVLSQNEIDAAKSVRVAELNVQNQQKIVWPSKLVVAKAYLDQLARSQALPPDKIAALEQAIQTAESAHLGNGTLKKLQLMGPSLEKDAGTTKNPADSSRRRAQAPHPARPAA